MKIFFSLIFLIFGAPLSGCSCAFSQPSQQPLSHLRVRLPPISPIGIFILVHGLNNPPEVMDPLANECMTRGYAALEVTLSGHEGNRNDISADLWQDDIHRAFIAAQTDFPGLPISLIGFSTGGTTLIRYLDTHPSEKIQSLSLLAPAVSLRWYAELLRPLLFLHHLGVPTFTLAPRGYRAYIFPPMKLYRALFDTVDQIAKITHPETMNSLQTQIFVAPDDEFMTLPAIEDWKSRNKLSSWTTKEVYPTPLISDSFRHLIIDEPSMGPEAWKLLLNDIFSPSRRLNP